MRVPSGAARKIVLRGAPRLARVLLDPGGADGAAAWELAADAAALDPALGELVEGCLRSAQEGEGTTALPGIVAVLDGFAASEDRPAAREIADALLLLLAGHDDRDAAARLIRPVRNALAGAVVAKAALQALALMALDGTGEDDWLDVLSDPELAAPDARPPVSPEDRETAVRAWQEAIKDAYDEMRAELMRLGIGLPVVAAGRWTSPYGRTSLVLAALRAGRELADPLERLVIEAERRRSAAAQARNAEKAKVVAKPENEPEEVVVPEGHVLVCRNLVKSGSHRASEVARGYEHIVGKPLPLVATPDLSGVRGALLAEFPQGEAAIDAILRGIRHPWLHVGHILIEGPQGSGKSRLARRLCELLGAGLFRVDGTGDGGASFAGTERRWYSSEPCRPAMAVARHRRANPVVLIDEIDKAATRNDYGRLWDAALLLMEPETAAAYQDPCLQVELDLSWVSIIATANQTWMLPGPLMDRFRAVVHLPAPGPEHMAALLPGIVRDIAREAGIDPRFHAPFDDVEMSSLRARWRGGSVRRLRRAAEAVLRSRDGIARALAH